MISFFFNFKPSGMIVPKTSLLLCFHFGKVFLLFLIENYLTAAVTGRLITARTYFSLENMKKK